MGSTISKISGEKKAKDHSRAIKKQKKEKEVEGAQKPVKLLLVGAGESGKSTITKQVKIIHQDGYSDAERQSYKPIVYANTVESMVKILTAMEAFDISFGDADCEEHAVKLRAAYKQLDVVDLASDVGLSLQKLWNDTGVKECYGRSREYPLNDSAAYFMEAFERLCDVEYVPTEQDVLRTRVKTTDVIETAFKYKHLNFQLIETAGSERQKLAQCFKDVTAIIFCVDLCAYDQGTKDNSTFVNPMLESLKMFHLICSMPLLVETSAILVLNKTDLFKDKISRYPLTNCFPEYQGESNFEETLNYIRQQFENQNNGSKEIYTHFTCATDTSNIRFVFEAVLNELMSKN